MRDQLEGRNPVLEALSRRRRRVRRIWLDERARPEPRLKRIAQLAGEQGVPIQRVERRFLDRKSTTGVHNGVIAEADELEHWSFSSRVDDVLGRGEDPCFVVADELSYEHNLGAVLRSSLGAGVHGVVIPTQRGKGVTPVAARVSMGGVEEVPVIREGLSSCLKLAQRAGLPIVGADMDGVPPWQLDLSGPLVLVLGGESKGLSKALRKRCDAIVGIPLQGGLQSLNVSVTAGVLLFERVRQRAQR